MPELPEVETIRQGLIQKIQGLKILNIEIRAPKLFKGDPELVINQEIIEIDRKGKMLVLQTKNKMHITVHLKMTGQMIWQAAAGENQILGGHPEKSYSEPHPHKHTHIIFNLSDGSTLYYNDLRKFGVVKVVTPDELKKENFLKTLGPEPLSSQYTLEYLTERIQKKPKTQIKVFLLDQTNIAGLGNIYVDESLFEAGIMPNRLNNSLSPKDIEHLYKATNIIIKKAIEMGGSTARDYVNVEGQRGTFLDIANVYRRTGLLCKKCKKTNIERMKVGGRSSHFCPICQK